MFSTSPIVEDPWIPKGPLFTREDDRKFKESVKFVGNYVKNLSKVMNKLDKNVIIENDWKMFAKVINRFFLVVTILGFGTTAFLVYILSPKQH